MGEVILEFVIYVFVEIIFYGIIWRIIKMVKLSGIITLKLLTLSNKSIGELKIKYANSSKPWFFEFGIFATTIYLIGKVIN